MQERGNPVIPRWVFGSGREGLARSVGFVRVMLLGQGEGLYKYEGKSAF